MLLSDKPPKPCKKFSHGKFSGFTEHVFSTGCKNCGKLLVFLLRMELMTKYGATHRN
jgi:hypothetical protein